MGCNYVNEEIDKINNEINEFHNTDELLLASIEKIDPLEDQTQHITCQQDI
jgi:hypothetical protein